MKNIITLFLLTFCLGLCHSSFAQVQYSNCSATGTNASAIGNKTTASGNNALAGGYTSQASGSNSLAFGYNSKATQSTTTAIGNTAIASGIGSMALGNYVKATAQNAFVFGTGTTANYPLTNSVANSIAFGTNSNKPTLLITKSLNNNYTGKVAIGPISTPTAKLHIKADNNEDVGVMLEVGNKSNYKAFISLFDSEHQIIVDNTSIMEFKAGNGAMNFLGDHYCFGQESGKKARLFARGTPSFYINATRNGNNEKRDGNGTSYAIDFTEDALTIRSALYQTPNNSAITNWKNSIFLCTDGKLGIGTKTTFLRNDLDNKLDIHAPNKINLESGSIKLTGKIGINTDNDVSDYALAVDGGIISTKVYIKEVQQWPDYVFSDNYALMNLDDLKSYLDEHKHLPGIPSEKEVLAHGYDINEMQSSMLQKIEELTQYILLLKGEIDDLQRTISVDTLVFNYDNNGNRILRRLFFERVVNPDTPSTADSPSAYKLFPNPTQGEFCLHANKPETGSNIHATLLNVSGTILEEKQTSSGSICFDLSNHPNGVYLLEVANSNEHETWKVIKK